MQPIPSAFANLPAREVIPGFHGRFVHTVHTTLAHWHINAGSVLPPHQHPHEQCTWVLDGWLEMTLDGVPTAYGPGSFLVIPPNHPHGGRALTNCVVFDVFSPVREDYRV
jgi:quercetin dioxygenase-like cupin family protein